MTTALMPPNSIPTTYSLLQRIGMDVSDWSNTTYPAANPKYCYNWAFVENSDMIAVNLWFGDIREEDDTFKYVVNARERAKTEKRLRKKRSEDLDKAIEFAWQNRTHIHAILIVERKNASAGSARVSARSLDTEKWFVESYNEKTGDAIIARGVKKFVDQYSATEAGMESPEKQQRATSVFPRDSIVRNNVRKRSKGYCEYCGKAGFTTAKGEIYIETHHVISLAEEGIDHESNVCGICPDDHRQAHHGQNALLIKKFLLTELSNFYKNQPVFLTRILTELEKIEAYS